MMMKRILALVLVLIMASCASAALVMDIIDNNPDTPGLQPSDIITINLREEVLPGQMQPWSVDPLFTMTLSNGDYIIDTFYVVPPSIPGVAFTVTPDPTGGFSVSGSGSYVFVAVPADGIVLTFDFHIPDYKKYSDIIHIDLQGLYGQQDLSGLSTEIHVTPEPITVALLGLGGLFLRRRK
jgi:hypothetical protein